MNARAAAALAVAAGVLHFVGFTVADMWPCSLVAVAPLVVALEGSSPRRSLVIGWLAGLTMNALGFSWLCATLRTFSGMPWPVCLVLAVLLCAEQGGRTALFAWLYARAREREWPALLVFPLAYVTSELAYPLLFPWYFGACAHRVPPLLQSAELGGPYLVSLIIAAPSLAIAEGVLSRLERRSARWVVVVCSVATPLVAAAVGLQRMRQIDERVSAAEPVRVGIVQANAPVIPSREAQIETLEHHVRMSHELRTKGVGFVLWSEGAVKGVPLDQYDERLRWAMTRRLGIPTLFGALLGNPAARDQPSFNVALAIKADGTFAGRYDKQRLFPFAEYMPLGEWLPMIHEWLPNTGHLTAGSSFDHVWLDGHSVTPLICYEDILPGFVNRAVNEHETEMLVNLSNDAWFGDTAEPWSHLALAQMRAVEHRRYLLRSSNSGVSAVIDPAGRIIAKTDTFRSQTLDAVVRWMNPPKTGYEIWGNAPWWCGAVAMAMLAFRGRRSALSHRAG